VEQRKPKGVETRDSRLVCFSGGYVDGLKQRSRVQLYANAQEVQWRCAVPA
jgi:hypothetical protein